MKNLTIIILSLFSFQSLSAQSVGIGTTTPEPFAVLDLSAVEQGFLMPRISAAARMSIPPIIGLIVYDIDEGSFFITMDRFG